MSTKETPEARARRRARAHYKPGAARRLPRLTDAKLREIARGYTKEDGSSPSDRDVDFAISDFDLWREWEPRRILGPVRRRQPYGRNAGRFARFLDLCLFWDRKPYAAADERPIRLRREVTP